MAQSFNNATVRGQKFSENDLADGILTESEGVNTMEVAAGPSAGGDIVFDRPVQSIVSIIAHASGSFAAGGAAPAALPYPRVPTHFTLVGKNADGVGVLTESDSRDYSSHSLTIIYKAVPNPNVAGAQSSLS